MAAVRDRICTAAQALEPLPGSVVQLVRMAGDVDCGANDIAGVLKLDQVLLGKTLGEANSASQSSHRTVGTAEDAVVRLGVARIVALALANCVSALMERPLPVYGLGSGDLALHAQMMSSIAAEVIRKRTGGLVPAELVTASLVHDMGKLVIEPFIGPVYTPPQESFGWRGFDWAAAEQELLGTEHAEIGRLICEGWDLPEVICSAVEHHHCPHLGPGLLGFGIDLADSISHAAQYEVDSQELVDDPDVGRSMTALGIEPDAIESMVEDTRDQWQARTGKAHRAAVRV
jgi:HD-like signal output (HDOD) protein